MAFRGSSTTLPTYQAGAYQAGTYQAGAYQTGAYQTSYAPANQTSYAPANQTSYAPAYTNGGFSSSYQTTGAFTARGPTTFPAASTYAAPLAKPVTQLQQYASAAPASAYTRPQVVSSASPITSFAAPSTSFAAPSTSFAAPSTMYSAPTASPMATTRIQGSIAAAPATVFQGAPMFASPTVVSAGRGISMSEQQLLSMGNVVSERVVSYEEAVACGMLRAQGDESVPFQYEQPAPVQYQVQQQQGFIGQVVDAPDDSLFIGRVEVERDIVAVNGDFVVQEALPAEEQQEAPALTNQAFVFIKPHAVTQAVVDTVRDSLMNYGINVIGEGQLNSEEIDERKLIDQHYYSIASKATMLTPDQLPVDDAKFQACFGIPWADALPSALNAMDAMQALQSDAEEINTLWSAAKSSGKLVKLGGGFYCGLLEKPGYQPIYSFNAFFMNMRSEYVAPGNSIYWFAVEWDEQTIPWADFRGKVLGPTDPTTAPAESIRGMCLTHWQQLGMASEPNTGNNCVHASASPVEAMYERMNWLGLPVDQDGFGSFLLNCQVPPEFIDHCATDPQVNLPDGNVGSVWDYLEDSDASTCVQKFVDLCNINMSA